MPLSEHLLVGLGNPGSRYRNTRHNLGRDALRRVMSCYHLVADRRRFRGHFGSGLIKKRKTHKVYSLLPDVYMNLSGESVMEAVRFYKVLPEQVVIFHDDLDLSLGKIRIKRGGGNGGHNGLRSVQNHLKSPDFVRVRLGIGRPSEGEDVVRFVLTGFSSRERAAVEALVDALAPAVPDILDDNFSGAMNRVMNPIQAAAIA